MGKGKFNKFGPAFLKPSKRDLEAIQKQRAKEEKELMEKMNIPPRDEEKYPMPGEDEVKEAGAFLYTANSVASSYDGNLQALLWKFNIDTMYALRANSGQEELFALIKSLTNLKEYMATSKNPLFAAPVNSGAKTNEGQEKPVEG